MMDLFKNIEFTDEEDEIMDKLVQDIPLDDEPEADEQPAESDEHADDK